MSDLSPERTAATTPVSERHRQRSFGAFWVTRLFQVEEAREKINRLVIATRHIPGIEIRGDEAFPDDFQPGVQLLKSYESSQARRPLPEIAADLRVAVPTLDDERPTIFDAVGHMRGRNNGQAYPEMFIMVVPAVQYLGGLVTERQNIFDSIDGVSIHKGASKRSLDMTSAYLPPGTEPSVVEDVKAIVAAELLPLHGVLLPATMPDQQ